MMTVDEVIFAAVWSSSRNLLDAAEYMGLDPEDVLETATELRSDEGVDLKPLDIPPHIFAEWWNNGQTETVLRSLFGFSSEDVARHCRRALTSGFSLRRLPA